MSGPDVPSTPPPEVPEEFADAYREAYERALAEQRREPQGAVGAHRARSGDTQEQPAVQDGPGQKPGAHAAWPAGDQQEPEEDWTEYSVQSPFAAFRSSQWFVPALLVLAAAVLVLGAYGIGRIFAHGVDDAGPVAGQTGQPTVPASDPSANHSGGATSKPTTKKTRAGKTAQPVVWKGPVKAVPIASADADCTAPSSVDAAGHPVTYEAANAIDGHPDTTWRCPGKAIGKQLVLNLGGDVEVGEVGLVPGYAKTDPVSGANRYAENNRITKVRWTFADGSSVVQTLDGSAQDRSLRTVRVPKTKTDTVTLQVLAVQEGPRHTTCVSEVQVARAG